MSKKASPRHATLRIIALVTVVIIFAEAFGYVWVRSQWHLTTQSIAKERVVHRKLIKKNKKLKAEQTLLKSPRELTRRAREELNLRHPTPKQTLHIN